MGSRGARGNWTTIAGDAGDFNGDGFADVLWRDRNGTVTNWLGGDQGFEGNFDDGSASAALKWYFGAVGDFNGDGLSDVVWWTGPSTGIVTNWLGTAEGRFLGNYENAAASAPDQWYLIGSGDFNGDGREDLLWRDRVTGAVTNWLAQDDGSFVGNFENSAASQTLTWGFAGTGDFDGDGRDDILWHAENGTVARWFGTATGGFLPDAASETTMAPLIWSIAGTGDFNGDGLTDVLWQTPFGDVTTWLMETDGDFHGNYENFVASMDPDWEVAAIGDFDNDGHDDILWKQYGQVTTWFGQDNGGFEPTADIPITVGFEWEVQPNADLFG